MTGSKKNLVCSAAHKRSLIDWKHPSISVARQCLLLGLSRSSFYYRPVPVSDENLALMRLLDEEYTQHPFLGVIKLTNWLKRQGYQATCPTSFAAHGADGHLSRAEPESPSDGP